MDACVNRRVNAFKTFLDSTTGMADTRYIASELARLQNDASRRAAGQQEGGSGGGSESGSVTTDSNSHSSSQGHAAAATTRQPVMLAQTKRLGASKGLSKGGSMTSKTSSFRRTSIKDVRLNFAKSFKTLQTRVATGFQKREHAVDLDMEQTRKIFTMFDGEVGKGPWRSTPLPQPGACRY